MSKSEDRIQELRRLLDPKTWPRKRMLIHGEVWSFVPSGDPEEERTRRALYNGRFQ